MRAASACGLKRPGCIEHETGLPDPRYNAMVSRLVCLISLSAGRTGFAGHGSGVKPRLLRTVAKFYQRHAQFDKRVAKRLKQIRERREQRIGQIRQRLKKRNALPREERSDTQRGVAPQTETARERRLECREHPRERNRVLSPSQERKRLRRKADQGDSPGSGMREPIRDR